MCYWVKSSNERLKTTTHYDSEPEQNQKYILFILSYLFGLLELKYHIVTYAKQYNQSKQPENQPKKHL